jgi:hypothetical protein
MNFVAGITTGGYAYGGGLGSYHVAGQRGTAVGAFDDGVSTNSQSSGSDYVRPVLNAVEEIKVFTTALPAEYGHSAGGVLDVVKKTGTNQFHGLASMYGRTRRMQHRLFFDRFRTSDPQPGLPNGSSTTFFLPDFNLSGPVIRNKTFFFIAYQHLIEKKTAQAFGRVPTQEMKNGDLSFGGVGNPIYDPATTEKLADGTWVRAAIPNNLIPLSRFDPVARKIIDLDPWVQPNQAGSPTADGPTDNLLYNENARVFFHDFVTRIDHQFSPNFKIFGSVSSNKDDGLGRPPRNIRLIDFDANDGNLTPSTNTNWSVGNTWIINPTMISDTRIGFNRRWQQRTVPSFDKGYPAQLGIPNVDPRLLPAFGDGDPNRPETIYGLEQGGNFQNVDETLSLRSDLTKVSGAHAFKMGYEILRFRLNSSDMGKVSGDFRFDNMTAGLTPQGGIVPRTGNTFAGFLLGYVRQATFVQELAQWQPRSDVQSFYFQDDWKVSPTLTLNLGIRYSNESQFSTRAGLHTNFDPTATDPVTGQRGAFVHTGDNLAGRDGNNFQPRIGLAWQVMPRWVLRAGVAVNTIDIKYPTRRVNFEEYIATSVDERAPGDPRPVYRVSQVPAAPVFNVRPDGTSGFRGTNFSSRSAEWWDPDLRNPYAMNWNLSIQRELGANYLLETSYQGSSGVGLLERWQVNTFPLDLFASNPAQRDIAFAAQQNYRPFPHFGDIRLRCNCGHSSYHSGTVRLEKRHGGSGLSFITFYTWSKSIDSQDNDQDGSGVDPLRNRNLEKALAGFHRAHRWVGTVLYELPFGQGKQFMNRGGILNHLFGGWELSWIQTMETGNPFDVSYSGNPGRQWDTHAGSRRPNAVQPNPELRENWRSEVYDADDRFSLTASAPIIDSTYFGYPDAFTPGNLGRNVVIGPNLVWSQVSAAKNISITERVKFQIRWDMQNALKHFNFDPPTRDWNSQRLNEFGKVRTDPRTASIGGQPLMNLTLALSF